MDLPFTPEQFLDVFARYNTAVWPAQVLLNVVAVTAVALTFRRNTSRYVVPILAALWLWMGVAYHWTFFSAINKAAYGFGALFVLQGVLFLIAGPFTRKLAFTRPTGPRGIVGAALMLYGLLLYPILGHSLGHVYPSAPTFGLPCPTTIFTLGLLLWAAPVPRWWVVIIPLLWSLIGFMAALKLGVREDYGLLVAGVLYVTLGFGARSPVRSPV